MLDNPGLQQLAQRVIIAVAPRLATVVTPVATQPPINTAPLTPAQADYALRQGIAQWLSAHRDVRSAALALPPRSITTAADPTASAAPTRQHVAAVLVNSISTALQHALAGKHNRQQIVQAAARLLGELLAWVARSPSEEYGNERRTANAAGEKAPMPLHVPVPPAAPAVRRRERRLARKGTATDRGTHQEAADDVLEEPSAQRLPGEHEQVRQQLLDITQWLERAGHGREYSDLRTNWIEDQSCKGRMLNDRI